MCEKPGAVGSFFVRETKGKGRQEWESKKSKSQSYFHSRVATQLYLLLNLENRPFRNPRCRCDETHYDEGMWWTPAPWRSTATRRLEFCNTYTTAISQLTTQNRRWHGWMNCIERWGSISSLYAFPVQKVCPSATIGSLLLLRYFSNYQLLIHLFQSLSHFIDTSRRDKHDCKET